MKVEGLPCTLDRGMTVVDIGKLSKNVKNIIIMKTKNILYVYNYMNK